MMDSYFLPYPRCVSGMICYHRFRLHSSLIFDYGLAMSLGTSHLNDLRKIEDCRMLGERVVTD